MYNRKHTGKDVFLFLTLWTMPQALGLHLADFG